MIKVLLKRVKEGLIIRVIWCLGGKHPPGVGVYGNVLSCSRQPHHLPGDSWKVRIRLFNTTFNSTFNTIIKTHTLNKTSAEMLYITWHNKLNKYRHLLLSFTVERQKSGSKTEAKISMLWLISLFSFSLLSFYLPHVFFWTKILKFLSNTVNMVRENTTKRNSLQYFWKQYLLYLKWQWRGEDRNRK